MCCHLHIAGQQNSLLRMWHLQVNSHRSLQHSSLANASFGAPLVSTLLQSQLLKGQV